jgi:GntR family transcriptional regulator/MocR family aminotransferase
MARSREQFEFESIRLIDDGERPLFRQLEDHLRAAIQSGELRPGQKLPSTRQLSATLRVARNTILNAYDQLLSEGYLESIHGSGTRVSSELPETTVLSTSPVVRQKPLRKAAVRLSRYGQTMAKFQDWVPESGSPRPFRPHMPAIDEFPLDVWKKLTLQQSRLLNSKHLSGVEAQGYRPLREAIADYMQVSRGVTCDADQILITSGAQQGFHLVCQLLLDPGDSVGLEDPGYMPARQVASLSGLQVISATTDEEGIVIDSLTKRDSSPQLIYATPGGQWPLGMTLSLPRRLELLKFAQTHNSWILEDDYNGEFRYVGRRLPAMASLDTSWRVIYMGSFSKLLFPAIRLGFLVVPREIVGTFRYARWLTDRYSPSLWQMVLCRFIETGQFLKHVRKMRVLYAERQQVLCDGLRVTFGDDLRFTQHPSGMHLAIFGRTKAIEKDLIQSAKDAKIDYHPIAMYTHDPKLSAGLILGFTAYTPAQMSEALGRWGKVYEGCRSG